MNRILTTFCLCFVITVVTLAQGYKDVTGQYIKNPNLESEEGWTYSRVNTSGETLTWSAVSKSYSGSFVSEIYAGDEQKYKTYEVWQKITLPRGTYHLFGRAFHRDASKVIMYARQAGVRDSVKVASVARQFETNPNSMDEASKSFNANMYLNDLAFTVEQEQAEVTIGYEGAFTGGSQWFALGRFTLYQVQDEVSAVYPVDVTPSLTRSYYDYTGLTGCYRKADCYIHEKYSQSNFGTGALVTQTFKGLEKGFYQVVIQAHLCQANGVGSMPSKQPFVIAGKVREYFDAESRNSVANVVEYTLSDVEVTTGSMRVGIYNQAVGGNWVLFNVKSVKYLGSELASSKVTLSRSEQFTLGSVLRADVETDIPLRAGQLNSISLPFTLTAAQTASTFTHVYTLAGVEAGAGGALTGTLISADSIECGRAYFVEVGEDKLFSATDVFLQTAAPVEENTIWGETSVGGRYGLTNLHDTYTLGNDGKLHYVADQTDVPGFIATVTLPASMNASHQPITLAPVDFANVRFTANLENIQARHFINDNTYTASSASVVDSYNVSPPDRRDQPCGVNIPVPSTSADSITLTITALGEGSLPPTGGVGEGLSMPTSQLVTVYNLYPQQDYTYTVEAAGEVISRGQFTTTGRLRMIKADSGSNIRDLGGWRTADGNRLRYGLIYRGGELNGGHAMNEADLDELRRLGFAAELDLREDVDINDFAVNGVPLSNGSALGADVPYIYENQHRFGDDALRIDTACWRTAFQFVVENLRAGRSVFFHCIWGADRTGCMAFLLEGLLGLPVDQLYKDYELTTFSIAGTRQKSGIDSKLDYINTMTGSTLQQRFFNYLLNVAGVPGDDLLYLIERMVDGESSITKSDLALMVSSSATVLQDISSLTAICASGSRIADGAHATLTDELGKSVDVDMRVEGLALRFAHSPLKPATSYTFTVPVGSVLNAAGQGNAKALTLSFRTPVVFDGEYYLYLPTLDRFLGRGSNYGTRAISERYGVPAAVTTDVMGVTTIQYLDSRQYLGSDGYTDKDAGFNTINWKLEQADAEHPDWMALHSDNGSFLYLYEDARARVEAATLAEATPVEFVGLERQKAIVQQQQQENILQAAQAAGIEAADVNELNEILAEGYVEVKIMATIKGAKSGSTTYWVLTEPTDLQNGTYNGYNVGSYGGELYKKHGFVSQTVTVKQPGLYKLTLTALYRQGSDTRCYELAQQGYVLSNAYVTVNDVYYAQVPDWYSDCAGTTNPNNTDQARALMTAGKYSMSVYAYIGEDLKATIAVNCPGYVSPGWCLFNNFAMTLYRSKEDAIEDINNDKLKGKNEAVYDLSGRRVNGSRAQEFKGSRSSSFKFQGSGFNEKLPKGVYIKGGKKVLVP